MHALVFTDAYAPHRPLAMLNVGRCGRTGVATTFVNKNQDDTQQQGQILSSFRWPSRVKRLIWVFPKIGVPQNGWFIMEKTLLNWIHLGETHYFRKRRAWNRFHQGDDSARLESPTFGSGTTCSLEMRRVVARTHQRDIFTTEAIKTGNIKRRWFHRNSACLMLTYLTDVDSSDVS